MDITSYVLGKKAGGGGVTPTGTVEITENGTTNVTNYAYADVNVQPDLEAKSITITENGTTTLEPTTGKDGISEVEIITNVSGGQPTQDGDFRVRFIDVDGTVLKEEWVNKGEDATPPANPSYNSDYLIFDEWNNDYTDIQSDLDIGAIYDTVNGNIYMKYETFPTVSTTKSISMKYVSTAAGTIDWGDGTIDEMPISTLSNPQTVSHTYSQDGEYMIAIIDVSNFYFYKSSNNYPFASMANINNSSCVKEIYLGNRANNKFGSFEFYDTLYTLKVLSIHKNCEADDMGNIFSGAYSLECLILPKKCKTLRASTFASLQGVRNLILPKDMTINSGNFQSGYLLEYIPNTVNIKAMNVGQMSGFFNYFYNIKVLNFKNMTTMTTNMNSQILTDLYSLEEVYFEKITEMPNSYNVFARCPKLKWIILNKQSVITLSGTRIFEIANNIYKVYVPDTLLNDYKAATNWSTIADRIKPISELPTTSYFYRYVK